MAKTDDDLSEFLDLIGDDTSATEAPAAPATPAKAPKAAAKSKAPEVLPDAAPEAPAPAPEKSAAQLHIERLKAELERPALAPVQENGRPVPETQLTEEQKQIRALEDQLAQRKAADLVRQQERFEAGEGQTVLIHILEDGFTAQGRVWYRGQELEFVQGGDAYRQTLNIHGNTWLDQDDNAQILMHGKVMFRKGPWPFQKLSEDQISAEERRRNRAAPVL